MSLIEKIEKLPRGWSIWQTHDGRIVIQIARPKEELTPVQQRMATLTANGEMRATLEAPTIVEAVDKALAHEFPISLSPRPEDFRASDWVPVKTLNRWTARHVSSNRPLCCTFKTKAELLEGLQRFAENAAKLQAVWDRQFGEMFPNGATEGIDYTF